MAGHTGWLVIEFIDDQSVSEIPTDWVIKGKTCYWPPYKPSRTTVAIKNCEVPDESWEKFPIYVFPGGIYYDYATARAKARKAEETSDLQSDLEGTKRKIKLKRYSSSEESGPDVLPLMPPIPQMEDMSTKRTSLLPAPPKMRKSFIRSDESTSLVGCSSGPATEKTAPKINQIQIYKSPSFAGCSTDPATEGSAPLNDLQIGNIDAGPSGSCTIEETLSAINAKLATVIYQLSIQRTLQLEIVKRLEVVENQRPPPPAALMDPSFLNKFSYLEFPLQSTERLHELEEILKEPTNFQDAVNEFANFGGANAYDFVKRVLGCILCNEVTIKYSWLGRRNKEAFAKLKLASVVIHAAAKAKVADTNKKCEGAMMSWLKRASDRQKNSPCNKE